MLRNPRGHSARNHTEVLLRSSQVSLQRNNHTESAAEAGCDTLLSVHVHLARDAEKYVKICESNHEGKCTGPVLEAVCFFMQEIKVV